MTVQWTSVDIPLGAGIDTKTNEKLLKPPAAADLVDAIFPASGVAGYETRQGYQAIDTDTTVSSIDTLVAHNNELLVLDGTNLYTVSEISNNVDLISRGGLTSLEVKQTPLDNQATNQTDGQLLEHAGLRVSCWLDTTIKYTIADSTTGAIVASNINIPNSSKAQITYTNNAIIIVYYNSSTAAMDAVVIPAYAPTTPSTVVLASNAHGSTVMFDCCESSELERVFLAFLDDSGSTRSTVLLFDEAGSVIDSDTVTTIGNTVALAVASNDGNYFEALAFGTNSYQQHRTDTYATSVAASPTLVLTSIQVVRASVIYVGTAQNLWQEEAGDIVTGPLGGEIRHSNIASSAFVLNGTAHIHLAYHSTLQHTFFLVDNINSVQAKCCVGIAGANVTGALPRVLNGTWAPVYREKLDIDVDPDVAETEANVFSQFGLKRVQYNDTYRPNSVQYGYASYINSGILWQYDGINLVEQGFHVYPEFSDGSVVPSNSTGGIASDKSYSYRVYYEWTNAQGERQRSTTARAMTATLGASDDTVTLTIPTLSHTAKGNNVSIVVYRTEGNPNIVGGAPFYRASNPDPGSNTGNNRYVANDITSDSVTFVDGLTDSSLIVNELDYLNSGELDNTAPKSASVMAEAKKRVWLAGFERNNEILFSKQNARKTDQLEFHDLQTLDVPDEDGPVTAFGELKHFVIVFKANSCFAISGEGPNNLGTGFFNLPQVVSLDVGCINQRSVVNTPQGILFQSNKGIWLLGENLGMQYVGANIEKYNNQTITSASIIPEENQVIFLTDSGSTLMYNYLIDGWARYSNHEGSHSVIWNGTYTYARNNGQIYRQGGYSDNGVHYAMKFVTAPVGIKGAQGKQRIRHVRLLGQYYSPHTLRIGLRYDHEPGVSDEGTWDPSEGVTISNYGEGSYGVGGYGGDGSPVYQTRFNLPRQKCQVIQFVIDTTNTGNAGRAVSIQAIQLEVGAKKGTNELSVDSSFSATGGSHSIMGFFGDIGEGISDVAGKVTGGAKSLGSSLFGS